MIEKKHLVIKMASQAPTLLVSKGPLYFSHRPILLIWLHEMKEVNPQQTYQYLVLLLYSFNIHH